MIIIMCQLLIISLFFLLLDNRVVFVLRVLRLMSMYAIIVLFVVGII